jgi:hypothetical protein
MLLVPAVLPAPLLDDELPPQAASASAPAGAGDHRQLVRARLPTCVMDE